MGNQVHLDQSLFGGGTENPHDERFAGRSPEVEAPKQVALPGGRRWTIR